MAEFDVLTVGNVNLAVVGCGHGELDQIYTTIAELERVTKKSIELLLICGDFESMRDSNDLNALSVPNKYKSLNSFIGYFNGSKLAPVKTIFIGGNHEASNVLQSLYYGGYVAPNIYYLGCAGVVNYKGIRIAGISGIYKNYDYKKGHFEKYPYNAETIKSIYHIRQLEVFRLLHLSQSSKDVDIFLSHDWPLGIWNYGNSALLLKIKPHFQEEVAQGTLGAEPLVQLLTSLKPKFWFAAHMHVKFPAVVPHIKVNTSDTRKCTRFLALDKVLPGRDFIQAISLPSTNENSNELTYDIEWLCVLKCTHHLLSAERNIVEMPSRTYVITPEEIAEMRNNILLHNNNTLNIPSCPDNYYSVDRGGYIGNSQTDQLLKIIGRHHVWTKPSETSVNMGVFDNSTGMTNTVNEINIDLNNSECKNNDPNAIDID